MVSNQAGIYIIHSDLSRLDMTSRSCAVDLINTNTLSITPVAGQSGEACGYRDGTGQSARLSPGHITQGPNGNLFISDRQHNVIRRVNPDGEVSLYAGTPNQ
jgi:hypothetical protein